MSHSPEPWRDGDKHGFDDITDVEGARVMGGDSDDYSRMRGDDIERTIQCVNALAGIPTEVLQEFNAAQQRLQESGVTVPIKNRLQELAFRAYAKEGA